MKKVVVVDIDGTISKVGERIKHLQCNPKNWDEFYKDCFEDEPIHDICVMVMRLYYANYDIVFCTGRRESCRDATLTWIGENITFQLSCNEKLLMRPNNDFRHDTEVKPELLMKAGIDFNSIAFVLEDRNVMVKKWRDMGLICLQVAEGDF